MSNESTSTDSPAAEAAKPSTSWLHNEIAGLRWAAGRLLRLLILQYPIRVLDCTLAMLTAGVWIAVLSFSYLGGPAVGGYITGWLVFGAMLLPIARARSIKCSAAEVRSEFGKRSLTCPLGGVIGIIVSALGGYIITICCTPLRFVIEVHDGFAPWSAIKRVPNAIARSPGSVSQRVPQECLDVTGLWPSDCTAQWMLFRPISPLELFAGPAESVRGEPLLLVPVALYLVLLIAMLLGFTCLWVWVFNWVVRFVEESFVDDSVRTARRSGRASIPFPMAKDGLGYSWYVPALSICIAVTYWAISVGSRCHEMVVEADVGEAVVSVLLFVVVIAPVLVSVFGMLLGDRAIQDDGGADRGVVSSGRSRGPGRSWLSPLALVWLGFAGLLAIAGVGTWWYLGPNARGQELDRLRQEACDVGLDSHDRVAAIESLCRIDPEVGVWGSVSDAIRSANSGTVDALPSLRFDLGSDWILDLVYVGEGSMPSDPFRDTPASRVGPFWLSRTEITQGQWMAVMGSNPSSFAGDPTRPVESVSATEAERFCERLAQRIGRKTRLPSGVEWEYACRAGSVSRFCFGDDAQALSDHAWFGSNPWTAGNSGGTTHPVGEKQPNKWGLYDMHGNVQEWCVTESGTVEARGGCWHHGADECESASRVPDTLGNRFNNVGFRVLVEASQR